MLSSLFKPSIRPCVLCVDQDPQYRFIFSQIFEGVADMQFVSSLDEYRSLEIHSNQFVSALILCVDQIDHAAIINAIFLDQQRLPPIILMSARLDAIQFHDLIPIYGVVEYIKKPFTKIAILDLFKSAITIKQSIFNQRLVADMQQFNAVIDSYNTLFDLGLPSIGFESLASQSEKLVRIREGLSGRQLFSKSNNPNILIIDDEKNIIDVYHQFVKNKPFTPYFSENLSESRQVILNKKIDLIALDLGLPDGHGIQLIHEIYKNNPTDPSAPDVMAISSYYEKQTVMDVINAGAKVYINKPMTYKKFISSINQLALLRYMRRELTLDNFKIASTMLSEKK
ncbi:MAG: response regulator [Candidatus Marinamargulisbacteria bacterium]